MLNLPFGTCLLTRIRLGRNIIHQVIETHRINGLKYLFGFFRCGIEIQVLGHKDNTLEWKNIELSKKMASNITVNPILLNKLRLTMSVPIDKDFEIIRIPKNIFKEQAVSLREMAVGLTPVVDLYSSQVIFNREGVDHKSFMIPYIKIGYSSDIPVSMIINGKEFDIDYLCDFNNQMKNYIDYNNLFMYDVYLTESLIKSRVIIPLMLSGSFDLESMYNTKDLCVPLVLNPILDSLYGDKYNIYSNIKYGSKCETFSMSDLTYKRASFTTRYSKYKIKLADKFDPVIYNNGITYKLI